MILTITVNVLIMLCAHFTVIWGKLNDRKLIFTRFLSVWRLHLSHLWRRILYSHPAFTDYFIFSFACSCSTCNPNRSLFNIFDNTNRHQLSRVANNKAAQWQIIRKFFKGYWIKGEKADFCTSLYFFVLLCTSLYFFVLLRTSSTSLYFSVLLCTSVYFFVLLVRCK
jgi:hypothetical protein